MKKVLSFLSTFVLTSSTILGFISNINTQELKVKKNNQIDWQYIKDNNDNYFENFKNNYPKELQSQFSRKKINQMITHAQKKAFDYIELFQSKNFNVEQIINFLSNENNDFKKNYNKILQEQNNIINQKLNQINNSSTLNNQSDLANLEKLVKNLKISSATFTTMTAAAAVAAAGFWAVSWMGWSIPWATACTVIGVSCGAITSALNIALVKYDKELSKIDKTIITGVTIFNLGNIFARIAYGVLISSVATVSTSAWAFPAAFAIIPVVTTITSWIKVYK